MNALEFRRLIEERGRLDAVRVIQPSCGDEQQADALIYSYGRRLILAKRAAAAGVLWLGESLFNPRPMVVGKVWDAISNYNMVLIQGSSSCAKSYTGIAWHWLRWHGDPEATTIKIISVTGSHAQTQIFDTLKMMQDKACCTLPGVANTESLLLGNNKRAGFTILKIKEGEDNSGVMQGFHPLPREKPHPVYGASTAVFAVIDEAEEVPGGVWTGVANMAGSDDGSGTVKATAFYNPKDQSSKVASLAEPIGGWGMFDLETGVNGSDEWTSKSGWHVVRLDAAKTENVMQRKLVYPNFHTYEDFAKKRAEHNGNTPGYYIFARGAYPPDGLVSVIIPQSVITNMRGEFVFVGTPVKAGGVDIAIDGRDEAIFTAGRFGLATAFRRNNGEIVRFKTQRKCLQIDQQVTLPKGSTKIVGDGIKKTAVAFGIAPEWCMIDSTGNGAAVHAYLCIPEVWSADVKGLDFSKPATTMKILEEDNKTAEEAYEGVHTEVWFAFARWGEFGYLGISPGIRNDALEQQLAGRRYKDVGRKQRAEKKDDYKGRIGRSPDHADAATILLHCVRVQGSAFTSMLDKPQPQESEPRRKSGVNRVQWVDTGV